MSAIDYSSMFEDYVVLIKESDGSITEQKEDNKNSVGSRILCDIPDYSDKSLHELRKHADSVRSECLCIIDVLSCEPMNIELRRLLQNSIEHLNKIYSEYNRKYTEAVSDKKIPSSPRHAEEEVINLIYQAINQSRDNSVEETVRICQINDGMDEIKTEEAFVRSNIHEILSVMKETEDDGFAKDRFYSNEGLRRIFPIEDSDDVPSLLIKIPLSGTSNYRFFRMKGKEDIWSLSEMSLPDRYREIKITEINKEKYIDTIDIIIVGNRDAFRSVYPFLEYPEINRIFEEYTEIQNKLAETRKDDGIQPETKYGIYGIVKNIENFVGGATEYCMALSNGTMKELDIIKRGVPAKNT